MVVNDLVYEGDLYATLASNLLHAYWSVNIKEFGGCALQEF